MMKFKQWINESVTFSIEMPDRQGQSPQDLNDLGFKLDNKLGYPQSQLPHGSVQADGFETAHTSGILNFYCGKMPEATAKQLLSKLLYYIVEFGYKIIEKPKLDQSKLFGGPVYRIHVAKETKTERAPELNVSNDNTVELFTLLGMPSADMQGSMSVHDLNMKLSSLSDFAIQMAAQAPSQSKNVFSGGRSVEQIKRYINTLQSMVQYAIHHGYDTIEWY